MGNLDMLKIAVIIIFAVAIVRAVLQIRYEFTQRHARKDGGLRMPMADEEALRRNVELQQRLEEQRAVDEHLWTAREFTQEMERTAEDAARTAHTASEAFANDVDAFQQDQLLADQSHAEVHQHTDQQMFGPHP